MRFPLRLPLVRTVRRRVASFARDEAGATMAEYTLLVAVIALVAIAGAKTLGTNLSAKYSSEGARVATP